MRRIMVLFLLSFTPLFAGIQDDPVPDLRLYGVKIKVTDMDQALRFYGDVLGFGLESKAGYPESVTLENDGMILVLSKTQRNTNISYPGTEQTVITFQANDLTLTVKRLRDKGVSFIFDQPQKVGIGIANKFRDPFGNVHSILEQQVGEVPEFEEPRIYNVGYIVADIGQARQFYKDLGFVVRTEAYFPPALPLGHRDGSFAFMLHHVPAARNGGIDYENHAQALLMFSTRDLGAFIELAAREEISLIHDTPRKTPSGSSLAFRSPAGLAAEMIEIPGMREKEASEDITKRPAARIEDMSWLAGHWLGTGLGGVSEEIWSPPSAKTMMGMYRSIKDGEASFYEFLMISEDEGSLVMRLKHFTPDFIGWEEKDKYVTFPLNRIEENYAKFAGLEIKRQNNELFIALQLKNKEGKSWLEKFHFVKMDTPIELSQR